MPARPPKDPATIGSFAEWYADFEVEVDLSAKINDLNSGPLAVANPWA